MNALTLVVYSHTTGRNRLSAEPWLGGDNRLGRLNLWGGAAWHSLQPWHSFLNRFAERASCPEGCLAQPSNLGLGFVPELPTHDPRALRCGAGERATRTEWSNQAVRTRKYETTVILFTSSIPAVVSHSLKRDT